MKREIFPILLIALIFAIAAYADSYFTQKGIGSIYGHWGASGNPDSVVSKSVGVYLLPALTLIIYLAFLVIPKIEVYKENLEYFSAQFWGFRVVFIFVMGVIYVATLLPNMGFWNSNMDPTVIIIPAVGVLFFYVGYMLNFTKRNYFIGVRTPWTLADEKIWEKTNRLAGRLFWACSAITFLSLVIPPGDLRLWAILLPLALTAIIATIYSLLEYKKIKRENPPGRQARAQKKAKKRRK